MWTNICMRPCLSMQCKLGFYLNHLLNFSGVYYIFCDVFHMVPYVIFALNVDPWLLLPNKHFMTCLQPRKQHGIVIYACLPLFFLLIIFPEKHFEHPVFHWCFPLWKLSNYMFSWHIIALWYVDNKSTLLGWFMEFKNP